MLASRRLPLYDTYLTSNNITRPALLVASESYYPNWHATVDGRPAEVLAAEGAFLALRVDPGEHDVL